MLAVVTTVVMATIFGTLTLDRLLDGRPMYLAVIVVLVAAYGGFAVARGALAGHRRFDAYGWATMAESVAEQLALEKLQLNDASLSYEPETSAALGFGFRCGFLGFLHAEIIQERLEREYALDLISTAPTVRYRVVRVDGQTTEIESPAALPPTDEIERIEEPMILATIHLPPEYLGAVLALCQDRRGVQRDMSHHGSRAQLRYELPLSEVTPRITKPGLFGLCTCVCRPGTMLPSCSKPVIPVSCRNSPE